MHAQLLNEGDARTFVLVFDVGDDPVAGLTRFAAEQGITAASFSAIGAFSEATLGYFDWNRKDSERIAVAGQVEVLALLGDGARDGGDPKVHAHVVLGLRDGTTRGGHLLAAQVRPTLEVVLTESPAHLARVYDPRAKLALIKLPR
jgi:predicted DNA-binding protein with PD1-like motif